MLDYDKSSDHCYVLLDLPFPCPASRFGFHDINTTLIKGWARVALDPYSWGTLGWMTPYRRPLSSKYCSDLYSQPSVRPATDVNGGDAEVARNLKVEEVVLPDSRSWLITGFVLQVAGSRECWRPHPLLAGRSSLGSPVQSPWHHSVSTRHGAVLTCSDALVVLGKLHYLGIAHLDIKSDNILVDTKAGIWVADQGLALTFESDGLVQVKGGTPGYMAPEVYRDQRAGPSADVYALGAVLYWLLTGHRLIPFSPDRQTFHNTRLQGVMPQHFDHPVFEGMTE